MKRSEVLPDGYTSIGVARAACGPGPAWGPLEGEPLESFDCSEPGLTRALAEQAAEEGADLLSAQQCARVENGGLSCSATLARRSDADTRRAAPVSAGSGFDPERLPAKVARVIEVDLEPACRVHARRSLAATDVAEHRLLPVSHVALGSLRARCAADECDGRELRVALRVAAGGLGASDLVGVSCAVFDGERECIATLAVSELDPATDPRAR